MNRKKNRCGSEAIWPEVVVLECERPKRHPGPHRSFYVFHVQHSKSQDRDVRAIVQWDRKWKERRRIEAGDPV